MLLNPNDKSESPTDLPEAVLALRTWIEDHSQVNQDPWSNPDFPEHFVDLPTNEDVDGQDGLDDGVILDPTFDREDEEESEWTGKYDKDDNLVGNGTLKLYNGDTFRGTYSSGVRDGWGVVSSPEAGLATLTGTWRHGHLTGKVRWVTEDTTVLEGWCSKSKLVGPARKIVMKKFRTFRQQVKWLGRYKNGMAYGQCWEWVEGGGYITGQVDSSGKLSGPNIAFVFPDLYTALLGEFKDGVMMVANPAVLTHLKILNDIAVPTFNKLVSKEVWYSKSNETFVGDNPLVQDPYELRTCQVLQSEVEGGGEGLYARRNIKKGEIVSFYNGVRLPYIPGKKEEWETSGYKIFVNADYKSGERIDLPGDLIHLENYRATLGHKMNHCFENNCTEWFFEHPRHGLIPCAMATKDIKEGEEFFLHYGYDPLNCPSWYKTILDEYMRENPDLELYEVADPERFEKLKLPPYKETLASSPNYQEIMDNLPEVPISQHLLK